MRSTRMAEGFEDQEDFEEYDGVKDDDQKDEEVKKEDKGEEDNE